MSTVPRVGGDGEHGAAVLRVGGVGGHGAAVLRCHGSVALMSTVPRCCESVVLASTVPRCHGSVAMMSTVPRVGGDDEHGIAGGGLGGSSVSIGRSLGCCPVRLYDCRKASERDSAIKAAVSAVESGDLVVMPTDTVYGLGADAFKSYAVEALLRTKQRGRDMVPPVLVGSRKALDGLTITVPDEIKDLAAAFWPGPLTLVMHYSPTLSWDLGDTDDTVAVRMPLHPVALEVLAETGPMAVSSANKTGQPPAPTASEAKELLGYSVQVYLEAGPSPETAPSTIVDCTGEVPQVLRQGALSLERLREVNSTIRDDKDEA